MTPARQQRKSGMTAPGGRHARLPVAARAWRLALAALAVAAVLGLPRVEAATTERVISDPNSGLAMNGIDPVAYFVDAKPVEGRPDQEYRYAGVVWRFRNEGNKAAFIANPEVYMPRYGGYDPIAIARAVAVAGNPLLWALVRERLYFFYNEEARARFLANPADAVARADAAWPGVVEGLVP
jgi:YHS domain-containing protein